MLALVPGRRVWSSVPLDQVSDRRGGVLSSHRKGDSAIVLSRPVGKAQPDTASVWVLFDRAFAKASGDLMPPNWKYRVGFVPCSHLSLEDPHPPKLHVDDPLFLAVREMRWAEPLTAKQCHARLVDAETDQPSLSAVKHCLTRLSALRACPLVHARGASDILSLIGMELSVASLLALTATAKSVRGMLEEDRLKRTGAAIMRYHERQQRSRWGC